MIMLFGGTTEGRQAAGLLDRLGVHYLYSTKAASTGFVMTHGQFRSGPLNDMTMVALLAERKIRLVIDAAHPFAIGLHRTIARASGTLGLPVIRFERDYRIDPDLLDPARVRYAGSFAAAIALLAIMNPRLVLASTGVQTIEMLRPYWNSREMMVRILDTERSYGIARSAGFPPERLLRMTPSGSQDEEEATIRTFGIDCLLCKENGTSGFLPVKLAAARSCGTAVVIVRRPDLPAMFRTLTSTVALQQAVMEARGEQ